MKESNVSHGTSTTVVLFLIFLTLKLTGLISWSWWWVTSPLWIGFGLAVIFAVIGAAITWWMFKDK